MSGFTDIKNGDGNMQIDFAKFKKTNSKHGNYSGRIYPCVLNPQSATDDEMRKIKAVSTVINTHLACKEYLLQIYEQMQKK